VLLGLTGQVNLDSYVSASNFDDFDSHLRILAGYINYFEKIIDYKSGDKFNFSVFARDINANKSKIVNTIQKLLDNKNIITNYGEHISITLLRQL
jgi:hypothetical protein